MDTLQKAFDKGIKDSFSFPIVGAKLIRRRLEGKGVFLRQDQIDQLQRKLKDIGGDTLTFDLDLDNDQLGILRVADGETIKLDINAPDQELDSIFQTFVANLDNAIPALLNDTATSILSDLRKDAPAMLKEHRRERKGFEHRLRKDWKKAFDLLEMFLVIALEAGDEFNDEFRKDESNKQNYVLEVLTRLHARACQIASEILVLLEGGYADGAHARWRSLHEIAVVGSFIKKHGNEVAERYLLHDRVESLKAADLYNKYYRALGDEPIPQDEYKAIRDVNDKLTSRFGSSYRNNHGWASSILSKENPTFSDIEEDCGLDVYRPYYKLASHNVHANPKGMMFRLGLLPSTRNVLLAGPSNMGFTDPAQGTAISLGNITITLLTTKSTIDNLVLSRVLLRLQSEIGEEFFKVQKEIENRTR